MEAAMGHAFDLGLRYESKKDLSENIAFKPAVGFSITNLGGDSADYQKDTDTSKYPLPGIIRFGTSGKISLYNLFSYTAVVEASYYLVDIGQYTTLETNFS